MQVNTGSAGASPALRSSIVLRNTSQITVRASRSFAGEGARGPSVYGLVNPIDVLILAVLSRFFL